METKKKRTVWHLAQMNDDMQAFELKRSQWRIKCKSKHALRKKKKEKIIVIYVYECYFFS